MTVHGNPQGMTPKVKPEADPWHEDGRPHPDIDELAHGPGYVRAGGSPSLESVPGSNGGGVGTLWAQRYRLLTTCVLSRIRS